MIMGVQPVGMASVEDTGALVIGELLGRLEVALEKGVDESSIEDAIAKLDAEVIMEDADPTDDIEAPNPEAVTEDVELKPGEDVGAELLIGMEEIADPILGLVIADPDIGGLKLIAGITEETGGTEVSGFISRSPMDRPASDWRLKRRNGGRDAGGQVTTSLSAGDVLLGDV
jgi:hypothetical protein